MSGYVGQLKGIGSDPNGIQFLLNRKTGTEKIFQSREEAIKHLHDKECMARDDMRFMFWYEESDDCQRHLLTGELVHPECYDKTEVPEDLDEMQYIHDAIEEEDDKNSDEESSDEYENDDTSTFNKLVNMMLGTDVNKEVNVLHNEEDEIDGQID